MPGTAITATQLFSFTGYVMWQNPTVFFQVQRNAKSFLRTDFYLTQLQVAMSFAVIGLRFSEAARLR
jgi:hypothetical protein